jgi:hypothetical protein
MREHESFCTIQWTDTNEFGVISQEIIPLPPSEKPQVNVTYTIYIDGVQHYGRVLTTGNRNNASFNY